MEGFFMFRSAVDLVLESRSSRRWIKISHFRRYARAANGSPGLVILPGAVTFGTEVVDHAHQTA
jgi:hypothetical protein